MKTNRQIGVFTLEPDIAITHSISSITTMAENVQRRRHNKELTSGDRRVLYFTLKAMSTDGHLPANSYAIVARNLGCAPRAVGDAYRSISKKVDRYLHEHHGDTLPDELFETNRKNCGRKQLWDRAALAACIKNIPLSERGNFRSVAGATGVPLSTIYCLQTKEKIPRNTVLP